MKIITLLFLLFTVKSDMHCQKLFPKENILFVMMTPMKDLY